MARTPYALPEAEAAYQNMSVEGRNVALAKGMPITSPQKGLDTFFNTIREGADISNDVEAYKRK